MTNPFKTHLLNLRGVEKAIKIGDKFQALLSELEAICPEGRELAVVRTKLQEACFFAKRSMAEQPENQENP